MLEMTDREDDIAFISTTINHVGNRTTTPLDRMKRLAKHNKEWDINDFELLDGWHYCKTDKDTGMPMIFTNFITGKSINKKGFRFELLDKNMNPVIFECIFENTVGKAKASGAKAMMKIYMRKDRNG
jgi:hypothetical protein